MRLPDGEGHLINEQEAGLTEVAEELMSRRAMLGAAGRKVSGLARMAGLATVFSVALTGCGCDDLCTGGKCKTNVCTGPCKGVCGDYCQKISQTAPEAASQANI